MMPVSRRATAAHPPAGAPRAWRPALALACAASAAACADRLPTAPAAPAAPAAAPTAGPATDRTTDRDWRALVAVPLGGLGGEGGIAHDVSVTGLVAGTAATAEGELRGFVWSRRGGMRALPPLPGDRSSEAFAVEPGGGAVGISRGGGAGERAVRWTSDGRAAALPPVDGALASGALDLNARGDVTGYVVLPAPWPFLDPRRHVVVWPRRGAPRLLGVPGGAPWPLYEGSGVAITQGGAVAATVGADAVHFTLAARWSAASGWALPDPASVDSWATDMNEWHDLVGVDQRDVPFPKPVVWPRRGARRVLAPFGDARGINLQGDVVGRAGTERFGPRVPVIWTRGGHTRPLPVPDGAWAIANAINELGEVAGAIDGAPVLWTYRLLAPGGATPLAAGAAAGALPATPRRPLRGWQRAEYRGCGRSAGAMPGPSCAPVP